jgi:hypothetical protein
LLQVGLSLQALVLGKIHCALVKIISDKWYNALHSKGS